MATPSKSSSWKWRPMLFDIVQKQSVVYGERTQRVHAVKIWPEKVVWRALERRSKNNDATLILLQLKLYGGLLKFLWFCLLFEEGGVRSLISSWSKLKELHYFEIFTLKHCNTVVYDKNFAQSQPRNSKSSCDKHHQCLYWHCKASIS